MTCAHFCSTAASISFNLGQHAEVARQQSISIFPGVISIMLPIENHQQDTSGKIKSVIMLEQKCPRKFSLNPSRRQNPVFLAFPQPVTDPNRQKKNLKRNVLCDIAVSVSVVLAPPQHHPRVYKNEYE